LDWRASSFTLNKLECSRQAVFLTPLNTISTVVAEDPCGYHLPTEMPVSLKRLQARQERVASGLERKVTRVTSKGPKAKGVQSKNLNPYLVGFLLFILVGGALLPHVQRYIMGFFASAEI